MYSIFEEEDENVATQYNRQSGMVHFCNISCQKFKDFDQKIESV